VRAALSSRKGLLMVMVALALAFVAAMMVSATAAHAQPTKKRAYCHARGNGTYGFIFVQQNSGADKAHQRHLSRPAPKTDIFLGSGFTSRAEARASFEERCTGGTTTTTTGQPPTTTTTTGQPPTTTTTTGQPPTTTTTTGQPPTTTTTGQPPTTTTTTGQPPTTTTTGKVIITPPDNAKKVGFTKFEGVKKTVFFDVQKNVFFITVNKEAVVVEKDVIVFTEDVPAAAAQYQYSASPSPGPLPDTGGSGLLPLAALVLLLGGGTAAFIVVKRGIIG
jgi:opacity protein-like surface antigen